MKACLILRVLNQIVVERASNRRERLEGLSGTLVTIKRMHQATQRMKVF